MSAIYAIQTRRGLRAWIARKFELANVTFTLRSAERDRDDYEVLLDTLPPTLKQLERDIGELRVRQAHLRNT